MARIIIVEDDEIVAEIVSDALAAAGHLASEVHDGAAALDAVNATEPDLVILDYNLPGQTGMEVLRQVRELAYAKAMPVMMLTSNASRVLKARAERTGADDYVVKPFAPDDLVRRVEALLVGRRIALAAQRAAGRV